MYYIHDHRLFPVSDFSIEDWYKARPTKSQRSFREGGEAKEHPPALRHLYAGWEETGQWPSAPLVNSENIQSADRMFISEFTFSEFSVGGSSVENDLCIYICVCIYIYIYTYIYIYQLGPNDLTWFHLRRGHVAQPSQSCLLLGHLLWWWWSWLLIQIADTSSKGED